MKKHGQGREEVKPKTKSRDEEEVESYVLQTHHQMECQKYKEIIF